MLLNFLLFYQIQFESKIWLKPKKVSKLDSKILRLNVSENQKRVTLDSAKKFHLFLNKGLSKNIYIKGGSLTKKA